MSLKRVPASNEKSTDLPKDLQEFHDAQYERLMRGISVTIRKQSFRLFFAEVTMDTYANAVARDYMVIQLSCMEGDLLARSALRTAWEKAREFQKETPFQCKQLENRDVYIPIPPALPKHTKNPNIVHHALSYIELDIRESMWDALKNLLEKSDVCADLSETIKNIVAAICMEQVTRVAASDLYYIEQREQHKRNRRRRKE